MRLRIQIDAMNHEIDSTDPELLGKWVVEMFARIESLWSPATLIQVQAQPSWLPTENGRGRTDWIADGRVIGNVYTVRSPQELVDALQQQIRDLEAVHAGQ
jgi:hypothetical protein